ncbi:CG4669, partial [Drosophila busckii]
FATYLKAFALIYVLPERQWSGENIDKLLREGEDLFQESSEADAEGLPRSQVYTNIEQRVSRKFKLEGHSFTIELSPAFRGTDPEHSMHQMKQLKSMLQQFFRKSYHGLFLSKGGYLLIWRRRKFYFVLDVKGRRAADLVSVRFNGLATVVCVQNLSNVTHLITNLSSHSSTDQFTIRELCVVRLVTPDGRIFLRDSNQRDVQYSVINKNYAYLKSTLHLSMNPKETLRNHSSLMVGVAAILASKIDHPAGWNTNMFDRLMCYGVELCRSCWGASVQERLPIDLDTFPTQLRLGQFLMELRLLPNYASGRWSCGIRYQGNDFEYEIRRALDKHSNALFQINNQMYALWRKDDFYYLLDPYRHTVISPALQTSEDEVTKWATVRMFRDLPTLLSVFHQLLKESNRQAPFNIHVVHIKNLVKCPAGYSLRPLPKDVDLEVLSLNEAIGFPVELNNCESILGEISDYEPDLVSETEDGFDIEKFKLLDEKDFDKLDEDEGEEEQEE